MVMKYNLDLIKQRAKEKHKRIMDLINALEASQSIQDNNSKLLEHKLGAELCSSVQSTEDLCELQNECAFYQYEDGSCYFIVDGIKFEVADLRSMRRSPRLDCSTYFDICVLVCSYVDDSCNYTTHVVPDCQLFGSTTKEFDEYNTVHSAFIAAAKKYIKDYNITPDMQNEED